MTVHIEQFGALKLAKRHLGNLNCSRVVVSRVERTVRKITDGMMCGLSWLTADTLHKH